MEMITKIYDFENEMERIKSLIDSMVSCLKMKIQMSLDNISYRKTDDNALKLRSAMVGIKSLGDNKPSLEALGLPNKSAEASSDLNSKDAAILKDVRTSLKKIQLKTGTAVKSSAIDHFPGVCGDPLGNLEEKIGFEEAGTSDRIPTSSAQTNEDSGSDHNANEDDLYDMTSDSNSSVEASDNASVRRKSPRVKSSKGNMYKGFVLTEDAISDDETRELLDEDSDGEENDELDDEDYEEDGFLEQILGIENEEPDEPVRLRRSTIKSNKMARKSVVLEVEPKRYQFQGKFFTLTEEGKYKCDSCDRVLKTRGGTLLHIKQLHLDLHVVRTPRERKTDEIPKYKRRKTERRQRSVKVLGPDLFEFEGLQFSKTEDGKFKCGSCPNILKTRDSALVHIKQRHLGEGLGTFLCHLCGKSFERDVYLKLHEINHTNPKSHHCDICGKAFTQYANLYNHKKIHKGELNFHCELENCGKRFLTRKQLITHMRRHTGERPFECSLCPKKFVRASELTIHLRSHSEDRPYECHLCDSKFFIKGRLGRHLKNVHKLVPANSGSSGRVLPIVTHEVIIEAEAVVEAPIDPNSQFVQPNQFLTFNDLY
ncbi:unnamed protein product [Allacma fusca]|uniref:C2H2-type domain-containing protein n=1 Tax=Allacma fusca TaxID=39272 RepID=A0A8J2KJ82_9HEXA|nr:unnamed protein product [Allacma fusca]